MSEERKKAEMAAVGAMLIDPIRVIPLARSRMMLQPSAWNDLACKILVQALYDMMDKALSVDTITVGDYLERQGDKEKIGGVIFLNQCMEATEVEAHAEYYLDMVRQNFIKDRIQGVCAEISGDAVKADRGDEMLKSIPARFAEIIDDVVKEQSNKDVLAELYTDWERAKNGEERKKGLMTPWPKLNEYIGNVEAGLVVLAGRPSQGKTTIEGCISLYNAQAGKTVGRVGLDMTKKMILARNVVFSAGVSLPKLAFGHAGDSEMAHAQEAMKDIETLKMFINDRDRELRAICTWARMIKARHGLDLLTIDYVQQVQVKEAKRGWNENQEITFVMQVLKSLSFELQIPIVILSQLSREVEKNERDPRLSDLRGSGSLEQDAAVVIFVFKDEKEAETKEEKTRRPMWVDIAKHQNGETGKVPFWFRPNYFRFDEADDKFTV
jgi:replicative DNA helicase